MLTTPASFDKRRGMKTDIPISDEENTLVSRVLRVFQENVDHRSTSGADKVLQDALNAWARKPAQEDLNLFKSMGVLPSTYDSLTRVKLVQIMAVLTRVFGQIGDKSWGFSPSPNPTLPEDVQAGIIIPYIKEGIKLAQSSGAKTEEEIGEYINAALQANEKQIEKDRIRVAGERVERMELLVDDILLEGNFTVTIIKQFIANLVKFGTGMIIGPCEEPVVKLKLRGSKDTVEYKPEITRTTQFFVPHTMDIYPSPGAIEASDADLCIRTRYTKATLARAAEANTNGKGAWKRDVIRSILIDFPNGVDIGTQTFTDSTEKAAQLGEVQGTTKKYEGVRWFGLASGAELKKLGINSDGIGEINQKSYYESEVIILANRVIYAKVCDPAIQRPVVKTTFYGDAVQFFGWPPASQIDNCQKLMNITMAALKKQLQLAGLVPIVVDDYSSFVDANRPGAFALTPGKVFLRNVNAFNQNTGTQGSPIKPIELPRIIREIIALFDAIGKLTDDASGFNRNMLGSGNYSGAARTARGLQSIQEASSIIASFVITNVDSTSMVPLLTKVVAGVNANHPDKRAKGDPQIIAKGQLSKVMNSSQQEMVAAGFQATQMGVIPQLLGPDKLMTALSEYLKSIDFPNADKIIPDDARLEFLRTMEDAERSAALMVSASQGGGMGGGGQPPPGGRPEQAQPQQAAKQAGLTRESAVEARRGAA